MMPTRRSRVKRARSALRMREKSAAAIPVRACAARTVSLSRSSAVIDILQSRPFENALERPTETGEMRAALQAANNVRIVRYPRNELEAPDPGIA